METTHEFLKRNSGSKTVESTRPNQFAITDEGNAELEHTCSMLKKDGTSCAQTFDSLRSLRMHRTRRGA